LLKGQDKEKFESSKRKVTGPTLRNLPKAISARFFNRNLAVQERIR
jgi:hypothetical protein